MLEVAEPSLRFDGEFQSLPARGLLAGLDFIVLFSKLTVPDESESEPEPKSEPESI